MIITVHLQLGAFIFIVFIADTGKEVFVWVGRGASDNEKKNGLAYAHVSLISTTHERGIIRK